jgi:hypothetical protein
MTTNNSNNFQRTLVHIINQIQKQLQETNISGAIILNHSAKFLEAYPSLTNKEAEGNFLLYLYIVLLMPQPAPIIITLPTEKEGPFDGLTQSSVLFTDANVNEEVNVVQPSDEETDFWSLNASQQNGSIVRIADCLDEETTKVFEEEVVKQLKIVKSLSENTESEFAFTSIELLQALALWRFYTNNKATIATSPL